MNATTRTPIIDVQVHAYERNRPERPWIGTLHGPSSMTGDEMVAAMDAAGVDGAILISPWSLYRYDGSYALEVHARHADRFGLVKPFDPANPAVAEEIAEWARRPGTVGVRVVLLEGPTPDPADPGIARIMRASAAHGLPVNMMCWDQLEFFDAVASRYPDNPLILDHLGVRQTFEPPCPADPFRVLPQVLALARHPHVAIKISGAGTLAREPFPYRDLRAPLDAIFSAYGFERCLWGTDWTRATAFLDYRQGVDAFRCADWLGTEERAMLMGGSLTRVYRWAPL